MDLKVLVVSEEESNHSFSNDVFENHADVWDSLAEEWRKKSAASKGRLHNLKRKVQHQGEQLIAGVSRMNLVLRGQELISGKTVEVTRSI